MALGELWFPIKRSHARIACATSYRSIVRKYSTFPNCSQKVWCSSGRPIKRISSLNSSTIFLHGKYSPCHLAPREMTILFFASRLPKGTSSQGCVKSGLTIIHRATRLAMFSPYRIPPFRYVEMSKLILSPSCLWTEMPCDSISLLNVSILCKIGFVQGLSAINSFFTPYSFIEGME